MENSIWPGWRTVRRIGSGSFGTVYEIERDVFGEREKAALKVISIPRNQYEVEELRNEGFDDDNINVRFESNLKDIVHEYSLMTKMKGNSNTVYCDDIKYERNEDGIGWKIYIKMELLTPLVKTLSSVSDDQQILKLAHDICSALVMCRRFNIVHRDIKPQNIFVAEDGTFKLGDFGIAKTSDRTTSGTVVGTFKYMAPEVFNNQPYGSSADIYSLGMVLYWLLNERRTPFLPLPPTVPTAAMEDEARRRRFLGEAIPAPRNGSPDLKEIVLKACAFDVNDRYGSAAEMLAAIDRVSKAALSKSGAPSEDQPERTDAESWADNGAESQTELEENEVSLGDLSETEIDPRFPESLQSAPTELEQGTATAALDQPPQEAASAEPDMPEEAKEQKQRTKKSFLFLSKGAKAAITDPKQPEDDAQDEKSRKKKNAGVIAAAAGLTAVIGVAILLLSGGNSFQADWTDWADSLPEEVTEENYSIQERTLYRQLETTQSTESDQMDGWELYDTVEPYKDYGQWSAWFEEKPAETETRQVESKLRYHYGEKVTVTSYSDSISMPGWTLEDITFEQSDFGEWSDWSQTPVYESESREVDTRTKYRFRDKHTTTSSSPSMPGWIQDGSKTTDGKWSELSNWSTENPGSESDTLHVEEKTQYRYKDFIGWEVDYGAYMYSETPVYASESIDVSAENPVEIDGKLCYKYRQMDRKEKWTDFSKWTDTPVSENDTRKVETRQIYRYQTLTQETIYHFYQWTDWTESWTQVSETDTRQVEPLTVYRYRDQKEVPVYHFYRVNNWSEWSETEVEQTDDRVVESKWFYHYRDLVTETTYFFRRWTDWTEYSEEPAEKSDTLEVQTKTQYRYRSKDSAGEAT